MKFIKIKNNNFYIVPVTGDGKGFTHKNENKHKEDLSHCM